MSRNIGKGDGPSCASGTMTVRPSVRVTVRSLSLLPFFLSRPAARARPDNCLQGAGQGASELGVGLGVEDGISRSVAHSPTGNCTRPVVCPLTSLQVGQYTLPPSLLLLQCMHAAFTG